MDFERVDHNVLKGIIPATAWIHTKCQSRQQIDTSPGRKSTALRYRHLRHFMKPGGFECIPVSRILQFAQGVALLNAQAEGLHKNR
jgi:hypothetical protein